MDNGNMASIERGAAALDAPTQAKKSDFPVIQPPSIRVLEIGELLTRDFPPMESLLGPWLRRQHLVMCYAYRGVGKTCFALHVAYAVAGGGSFLGWKADRPRKVLYIDGEMPGCLMKERIAVMVKSGDVAHEPPEGNFRIITPDVQEASLPDLATREGQAAFESQLRDAELIVVDNLSSLTWSGVENEGESWLPMASWALARRREGRAVLFIHHEGKNGKQRGTSRREDLLDVVIRLKHPTDYTADKGAQFIIEFEKSRSLYGKDVQALEATLIDLADSRQKWTWKDSVGATQDRVVELIKLGMSDADTATELGIHRSTVYRARRKAEETGLVTKAEEVGTVEAHHGNRTA